MLGQWNDVFWNQTDDNTCWISSVTVIERLWLSRNSPLSPLTTTFNSSTVPHWSRLYSGCSTRMVWMSPKAWRPTPILVRRVAGVPSTILSVLPTCSRCRLSIFQDAKLTGRSPVYVPPTSHWPPKPSSKPSSVSSPSVNWTSAPVAMVSVIRPFSLLTESVVPTRFVLSSMISWSLSTP